MLEEFATTGFLPPFRLFSPSECGDIFRLASSSGTPKPKSWDKAQASTNPDLFRAAADRRILEVLVPLLGPNIIVWGCRLVTRHGEQIHHFHTDIESAAPAGGFVSLWVGLHNTGAKSGLKYIPGSHRYGVTVQQAEAEAGLSNVDEATVLRWARGYDPAAEIVQPDVEDGLALVFDGRLWHGSHNVGAVHPRTALLLQYAAADQPIRIPLSFDSWPPEVDTKTLPPVIAIAGTAPEGINNVVRPPKAHKRPALENSLHRISGALADPEKPFQSAPHLKGSTEFLDFMECHSSALAPGAWPHQLHWHKEEELLVVLSGQAALRVADDANGSNERDELMGPGDFAYYPAFFRHTLTNVGSEPLQYTMFKWSRDADHSNFAVSPAPLFMRVGAELFGVQPEKRFYRKLFEQRTHWLGKLHAHLSVLPPEVGYEPHADKYDVGIVLLAGAVETLGQLVSAPAVLFHPKGAWHGLKAVGDQPARYLVFEFHSHGPAAQAADQPVTGKRAGSQAKPSATKQAMVKAAPKAAAVKKAPPKTLWQRLRRRVSRVLKRR